MRIPTDVLAKTQSLMQCLKSIFSTAQMIHIIYTGGQNSMFYCITMHATRTEANTSRVQIYL